MRRQYGGLLAFFIIAFFFGLYMMTNDGYEFNGLIIVGVSIAGIAEASKLLNKDKEKIINELTKLLKVVDGDKKIAESVINKIKTNLKI